MGTIKKSSNYYFSLGNRYHRSQVGNLYKHLMWTLIMAHWLDSVKQ